MSLLQQRIHGMGEGVTMALDSIRANKVRAGLTTCEEVLRVAKAS